MSNLIPKSKGEKYTLLFGLIFTAFIVFKLINAQESKESKGIDEFSNSMLNSSANSEFFLYSESRDVYEDKWYAKGTLGESTYQCLKDSPARLDRLPEQYRDIYLAIEGTNARYYFVLKVDGNGKVPFATFTEYKQGEYGFRSLRYLKLGCELDISTLEKSI